jgi:Poly(R)-hydroxyalkanoic acid synthase subunit (PHA_synth_III_E)
VGDDIWSQWQAFAALMGQASRATPHFSSAHPGALAFAPFIAAAERFTVAARKYLEDTANASAPESAEAVRAFSDFLRAQSTDFFRFPWSADFYGSVTKAVPPASMINAPALGLTREHQQRAQRAADAGRRIGEAQRQLQFLLSDALRDAATAFAARIEPPQPIAVSAEALRSLYNSWIDCAEEAYARAAHSDTFCNALADFVNASSLLRRELQANMEHWAKLCDLPTRSELNTLTHRLKCVEEELRAQLSEGQPRHSKSKARASPRARRRATRSPKP